MENAKSPALNQKSKGKNHIRVMHETCTHVLAFQTGTHISLPTLEAFQEEKIFPLCLIWLSNNITFLQRSLNDEK